MAFIEKYNQIRETNKSYLCVGLDSDIKKIPSFLKSEKDPILTFNKRIIDETCKYTAAYKPNFAFYIAQGVNGIETLKKTLDYIPDNILKIVDIKAGDIGNTMEQYTFSVFEYFNADAMTINILMGSDVINSCLQIDNAFAFALALTSNESADQYFMHHDLYKKIATTIENTGHEKLGAVVGATRTEDLETMRALMPEAVFLIPGIGAQGGDLEQVCKHAKYKADDARFLISSSRGIIFADNTQDFALKAGKEAEKLRDEIEKNVRV